MVAPPEDADPAKCLGLKLSDDQVSRLVSLLDQDMQAIGRAAPEPVALPRHLGPPLNAASALLVEAAA